MPRLTNPQIDQLLEAMLGAFDRNALRELLQFHCDRALDQIVSPDDNLRASILKVINAANREYWIASLLRGVAEMRPDDASLRQLIPDLLAWVEPPPLDPSRPPREPGPLPPGSRPGFPRNAVFTGRADDLRALAAHLLASPPSGARPTVNGSGYEMEAPSKGAGDGGSTAPPLILTGIGGTGKSQLANEFCHRYGRWFEGVHWVATTAGIDPEIAACGPEMGVQPWPQGQPDQVATTLGACAAGPARLVVLDNLEEPDALRDLLAPARQCARSGHGPQ